MADISLVPVIAEDTKAALVRFAIEVNREVCIRIGRFTPADADDRRQLHEGPCAAEYLNAVVAAVPR